VVSTFLLRKLGVSAFNSAPQRLYYMYMQSRF
jgi:hypothetical protein